MKDGMTYREVERVRDIIVKGQNVTAAKYRMELTRRKRVVRDIMEAIDEARKPSDELLEYFKKENAIYAKFGSPVTDPSGRTGFRISDWGPVQGELSALREEHKKLIEENDKNKQEIEAELDKEVEENFEIKRMKDEWFGDFITSHDSEFLMDMDLLDLGDYSDGANVRKLPKKKVRKSRNK